MTDQHTLSQRFRDLRREPDAPDWSHVLDRAEMMPAAGPRLVGPRPSRSRIPRRIRKTRKTTLIALAAAITAMGFAGVAYSLTRPSLPFTAPTPEDAEEATRKAPGIEEKIHDAPRVDGQTWDLRSYDNVRGDLCFTHKVPGELVGTGCMPADKLFADGPLYALHGARQIAGQPITPEWDNQWVYGIAHPAVTTLTLVNMDCSTVPLSMDKHGAFNYVASSEDIRRGRQLYKLVARGQTGTVLAERKVAIGLTRIAKDAGLEPPRPREACS
jgi:hypothetical protein